MIQIDVVEFVVCKIVNNLLVIADPLILEARGHGQENERSLAVLSCEKAGLLQYENSGALTIVVEQCCDLNLHWGHSPTRLDAARFARPEDIPVKGVFQ